MSNLQNNSNTTEWLSDEYLDFIQYADNFYNNRHVACMFLYTFSTVNILAKEKFYSNHLKKSKDNFTRNWTLVQPFVHLHQHIATDGKWEEAAEVPTNLSIKLYLLMIGISESSIINSKQMMVSKYKHKYIILPNSLLLYSV